METLGYKVTNDFFQLYDLSMVLLDAKFCEFCSGFFTSLISTIVNDFLHLFQYEVKKLSYLCDILPPDFQEKYLYRIQGNYLWSICQESALERTEAESPAKDI